jgi:ribosomal-protein-alanine N-acetyltransferase
MDRAFFMTTDRIGFSRWRKDDLPLARLLWADPAVSRWICAGGRFSDQEISARLEREIHNEEAFHMQYWPIFALSSGAFLGCCGLRPYCGEEYEVGFHLRPEFWGKGYASEAAAAVMGYGFSVLKAQALFAGHHPENLASSRVLGKLGFHYIGDRFYEPTGRYHPSYEFRQGC